MPKTKPKTAHNAANLRGHKFGRWYVVARAENRNEKTVWVCRCRCGVEREVVGQSLRNGVSTSCGCERGATYTPGGHTANKARPLEYGSWSSMRLRCTNTHFKHYHRYGGRGISICARWANSFADFLADMGPMPAPGMTIERIDNDGNYEAGNCKWATRKEQAQNRTFNPASVEGRERDALNGRFVKDDAHS